MNKVFAMKSASLRAVAGFVLVAVLSACGGGGGSAGDPLVGGGGGSTGGGTGGGGSTVTDAATVAVALSSTTVTAGAPATVTATVKNKAGSAIPGLVVKFTTDGGLGAFSAASALTDANGVASVVLSPAQSTTAGADMVKATVSYLEKEYSAKTGFQLTATNVTISSFTSDVANLSAYGQANLTVALAGTSANSAVSISITSSCTTAGKGTITPASQTTTTGRATFTFRDGGCGAVASSENLQISVAGTTLTQSLTLPVSSPQASSIGFVSASPSNIYLRGSGLVENSNVIFQVKDANNNGLPGQNVVLEPTVLVGGLTLDGGSTSVSKITDSEGKVIVRVNSGTVPTPVRIKATLQGSSISTVSSVLAVAVGLPSQLNFSMAQGTINIEGYNLQGTPNTYTVVASDRLGNPVPDGTAINFVTEGGQIQAIKQTATSDKGIASTTANFVTADPVPTDGRVTVVAYALGEKSFLDLNGNNTYDDGELFQDLGDIFLDRKFDNFYFAAEDQFISGTTGDGTKECLASPSALLATGVSIPSRPGTCSQTWARSAKPIYVRRAVQTIFSTSSARPLWGTRWSDYAVGPAGSCAAALNLTTHYASDVAQKTDFRQMGVAPLYGVPRADVIGFTVADANPVAYNPVAAGTVITAAASTGLAVTVMNGTPVPSTSTPTGGLVSYKFDDVTNSGTITISFKSPSGLVSSVSQFLTTAPYGDAVRAAIAAAETPTSTKKASDQSTWSQDERDRFALAKCLN